MANPQPIKKVKLDEEPSSSKELWDGPSPQFPLVGIYRSAEIKGEKFPEKPSAALEFESDDKGYACMATKGKGRLFVPTDVLKELCRGAPQIQTCHQITGAQIPLMPTYEGSSDATSRSDVLTEVTKRFHWYYGDVIRAMKPVADYVSAKYGENPAQLYCGTTFGIYPTWDDLFHLCQQQIDIDLKVSPVGNFVCDGNDYEERENGSAMTAEIEETENFLKNFQLNQYFVKDKVPVVYIIDLGDLEDKERKKCTTYHKTEASSNSGSTHGQKVFKFVATTSADNTEINYINVAASNSSFNFLQVAAAFYRIICETKNKDIVWINCSFSLDPFGNPAEVTNPDNEPFFRHLHQTIHDMGFLIFGAAGNSGYATPHHPWGQCSRCIVVGAEDNVTKKIAAFSSGCCTPLVDIMARGCNFAASNNRFSGTSFSTAIISGAMSYIVPHIWSVEKWKAAYDILKDFLSSTVDKKFGCSSTQTSHVSMQWNSFNFEKSINALVLTGKLPPEVMSTFSAPGSSTKVNLDIELTKSPIRYLYTEKVEMWIYE